MRRRLANRWHRLWQRLRPSKQEEPGSSGNAAVASWFDPRWDIPLLFLWAVAGYEARPYAGPTTLLLSHDLLGGAYGNPIRDWKKFNPRLESRELVGSHLACITEHVDGLAETIRACLEENPG